MFLALQDTVPPVRQGVRDLPTAIIHSGLAPPTRTRDSVVTRPSRPVGTVPPVLMSPMISESYTIVGAIASNSVHLGVWRISATISCGIPAVVMTSSTASPRRFSARRALCLSPISRAIRRSSSAPSGV